MALPGERGAEPQPGASRSAEEEEDGGGSGGQPEALSLEEILRLYNQPINEEQAWAVCYQCCGSLRARARRGETPAARLGAAAHLRVWRDGTVTLEQGEPHRPPSPAADKSGRLHCTEMEVIESLGIIIYKALDYGLKDNEERELSPPLEQLIDHMTNTTETDGSRDEGYDALDEGVEDEDDDKEEVKAIRSYKDVMKISAVRWFEPAPLFMLTWRRLLSCSLSIPAVLSSKQKPSPSITAGSRPVPSSNSRCK